MIQGSLRFAYLASLVVWIGGVVFFSLVTAPALFGALPRDMAGRATAAIFPRYYLMGGICGAVALVSLALLRLKTRGFDRLTMVELTLLVVMTALTLYAGQVILPETSSLRPIMNARGESPEQLQARARFSTLHRRSVMLNGMVLLCGIGVLVIVATPRAGGGP